MNDTPSKSNPVLAAMSTLVALQLLLASAAAGDVMSKKMLALLLAMIGAVQFGIQFYVRGQVTPSAAVVARRTDEGVVVAGPSAQAPTGVEVQEPVAVPDAGHVSTDLLALLLVIVAGVFLGGLILHLVLT